MNRINKKYFSRYTELLTFRGLTPKSIKAYQTYVRAFLNYIEDILHKPLEKVTWQDRRNFITWIQKERGLKDRTVNHIISQLKEFTIVVQRVPWIESELPRRKFDRYMPYVPSHKLVMHFIDTISDLKTKAIISLMYSSGLRVSELCGLKCTDINGNEMSVYVAKAKNRSDRYAPLSSNALDILISYYQVYKPDPNGLLFTKDNHSDKPMDAATINKLIHYHEDELGLERKMTCHTFRRALGTHLYEMGTDLVRIMKALGHRSIESTTIYIITSSKDISDLDNPFDDKDGDE